MYIFTACDGSTLYMGRDKEENELLIRYGFPEDVWFHVDNLSSAHVYLRLKRGTKTIDLDNGLSKELLEDCGQLVKWNSIQGKKLKAVRVVFTPWANLKKTQGMETGQ